MGRAKVCEVMDIIIGIGLAASIITIGYFVEKFLKKRSKRKAQEKYDKEYGNVVIIGGQK